MDTHVLGALTPKEFLSTYWQKQPLLIRQAVPGFTGSVTPERLFELACDADVESRLVSHGPEGWTVTHGPQRMKSLRRKSTPWTVLVQGMNLWDADTDALMRRFDFIPQSRLDDLMVSYAIDGGGVGPHFDDYDVFLLQGIGQRRWRIGRQADRRLVEDAPLKILADFQPEYDWILEPGDMLYLPPEWAHDGVAMGECMTYSIGFRSPSAEELVREFLEYLQDRLCMDGLYRDPDLKSQRNSARISDDMIDRVGAMIARLHWSRSDVGDFLGHYLSEPKANVFFEPPAEPLSSRQFSARASRHGLALDRRSILLYQGGHFYLNGERQNLDAADAPALREFAHARRLDGATFKALSGPTRAHLHEWHEDGFAHVAD
ncbi:cupin domain-containing protein [Nitrogeniibacter mangrovi]|uniref:Cupin domain-containing protein n=1 Tax=Nitrogeniibacter mangrovi TaxID=2016596 RepID=A0A6C1B5L8_9RHOO|nr:cupin domain-containing protein [Nitrogeniibacter mangrovi]QID18095.1 cupin domain-containing protein [Nitrogeniibacter mangrovi]